MTIAADTPEPERGQGLTAPALPIERERGLRRERDGSRPGERGGEAGEHYEVGVERHALDPARPERGEPVVVLQASELPLDGGAAPVEVAEPLGASRDERVSPVGL
jgi:hypothetical protein